MHRSPCLLLVAAICLRSAATALAQTLRPDLGPVDRAILSTLRPGHPRLICVSGDLARVKQQIAADSTARAWHDRLRSEADRMLTQPPVRHVLIGPRLLDKSRTALDRISKLALLYRLDGDRRYAERARLEMLTVAAFPDWNPSHFLDVAEMTHAVAIGYDWLYDYLSPEDRATLRNAIVEMGLNPAVPLYRDHKWWTAVTHNWNQVCNGGMTLGALAVADEEPDLAAFVLSHAVASVKLAMASYGPDGGWAEGPGYWTYATRYNVFMLAGLESGLGRLYGLDRAPGFAETGLFPLYFTAPTLRTFNYADSGDREGSASCLMWLSRHFNRPLYAWMERHYVKSPEAYDLVWFDPRGSAPSAATTPLCKVYTGVNVAFMRGAWNDPNALSVSFKGGDNAANHSHLDLGTFVLDAQGQRWALDLGSDDYNLPGYFGKQRFTYYRLSTAAHSTLTLNGANQATRAVAPIIRSRTSGSSPFAIADLSAGYRGQAERVWRGVRMESGTAVLVEDEVDGGSGAVAAWTMLTPAAVEASGTSAVLTLQGRRLTAEVLAPEGARFETEEATAPPPNRSVKGIRRLLVRVPCGSGPTRIAVRLSPGSRRGPAGPVLPLAEWR